MTSGAPAVRGGVPRVLLLIASTSYRAKDFLAAAAALGVEVVVGSDHRQVLARHGDGRSLHVDLADETRGVAAIVAHTHTHPVDAVVGTDDDSVLLAAAAARALGHRHNPPCAVRRARDKLRFREALAAAGVRGPRFRCIALDAAADAMPLHFPCVVKPRGLSASRGVLRVNDRRELAAACRRIASILASAPVADPALRRSVLLEEYVHGDEVALEGMLDAGRLQVLALFDKPDPLHGPTFEETLLVTPSRHPPAVQAQVAATVERAARALGLHQGPVHAELRINAGGAWMVELAPRTIGGLCSRALRLPDGDSLEMRTLRNVLALPPPSAVETDAGASGAGASGAGASGAGASGVMMIPIPARGRLRAVSGQDAARAVPGIDDVVVTIPVGDLVEPLPEGGRYLGFLFARGAAPAAVEAALRAAHRALRFDIGA